MRKAIVAAFLCVLVVGCSKGGGDMAASGAPSSDGTYTFAINAKQGQVFDYDIAVNGAGQKIDMGLAMTATKVEGDQTTFETKYQSMSMNGQPQPAAAMSMMSKMVVTQVMDKHGKTLSTSTAGLPAGTPQNNKNAVTTAAFPDKPVKVGDTWSADVNGVTANYKFASVSNEGGKSLANLEVTLGANQQMTLDGPMKIAVDTATGMPVSVEMNGTSAGQKIGMTMKQTN